MRDGDGDRDGGMCQMRCAGMTILRPSELTQMPHQKQNTSGLTPAAPLSSHSGPGIAGPSTVTSFLSSEVSPRDP